MMCTISKSGKYGIRFCIYHWYWTTSFYWTCCNLRQPVVLRTIKVPQFRIRTSTLREEAKSSFPCHNERTSTSFQTFNTMTRKNFHPTRAARFFKIQISSIHGKRQWNKETFGAKSFLFSFKNLSRVRNNDFIGFDGFLRTLGKVWRGCCVQRTKFSKLLSSRLRWSVL